MAAVRWLVNPARIVWLPLSSSEPLFSRDERVKDRGIYRMGRRKPNATCGEMRTFEVDSSGTIFRTGFSGA